MSVEVVVRAGVAGALLAVAVWTDVRRRVIRNWAVAAAGAAGLALGAGLAGAPGVRAWLEGTAAGALWWPAVRWLRLGAGDAKLAMALGAVLGPTAAVAGPAVGYVLCALCVLPWACWRAARRLAWRGAALPMAPWIAAGTALVWLASR